MVEKHSNTLKTVPIQQFRVVYEPHLQIVAIQVNDPQSKVIIKCVRGLDQSDIRKIEYSLLIGRISIYKLFKAKAYEKLTPSCIL